MTATTYSNFNEKTESLEVAEKFAKQILGKTIFVTGVNRGGIGFSTAKPFASQSPSHLIIAGRKTSRIQECIDALKAELPHLEGVRDAAATLLSWDDVPEVNILVNNAAVTNLPERTLSEDGLEMQFATNHIGHFLFTCLIMPKLIKAAENSLKGATQIINVSSLSPTTAGMRWSDIKFEKINRTLSKDEQPPYGMHRTWGAIELEEKSYLSLEGHNQSKVANVLFSIAVNKRLYQKYDILSMALHPGIIPTELSRYAAPETLKAMREFLKKVNLYFKTLGAGASTTIVAATDPGLGMPMERDGKENWGAYLIDYQLSDKADPRAMSSKEAEKAVDFVGGVGQGHI